MNAENGVVNEPSNIVELASGVQPIAAPNDDWEKRHMASLLAGWKRGDDARDLAYYLGLRPCPTAAIDVPFVRGERLHYPDDASWEERSAEILTLLFERFPAETAHLHGGAR